MCVCMCVCVQACVLVCVSECVLTGGWRWDLLCIVICVLCELLAIPQLCERACSVYLFVVSCVREWLALTS
jgi:hypothetical protein